MLRRLAAGLLIALFIVSCGSGTNGTSSDSSSTIVDDYGPNLSTGPIISLPGSTNGLFGGQANALLNQVITPGRPYTFDDDIIGSIVSMDAKLARDRGCRFILRVFLNPEMSDHKDIPVPVTFLQETAFLHSATPTGTIENHHYRVCNGREPELIKTEPYSANTGRDRLSINFVQSAPNGGPSYPVVGNDRTLRILNDLAIDHDFYVTGYEYSEPSQFMTFHFFPETGGFLPLQTADMSTPRASGSFSPDKAVLYSIRRIPDGTNNDPLYYPGSTFSAPIL